MGKKSAISRRRYRHASAEGFLFANRRYDDPDDAVRLDHDRRADATTEHLVENAVEALGQLDDVDVTLTDLAEGQRLLHRPARRRLGDQAQVSVTDDADQLLTLDDRKVTNPVLIHHRPRLVDQGAGPNRVRERRHRGLDQGNTLVHQLRSPAR